MELDTNIRNILQTADIVVFEGFEMTGKSYLARKLSEEYQSILYRPDWEHTITDKVLQRGNRFVPGLSIADFWKQLKSSGMNLPKLMIDRWLAVSRVYQVMYNQPSDCSEVSELVKAHQMATEGMKVVIIHKSHKDLEEARMMYQLSKKSDDHEDIYDRFDSFEDYYEAYLDFNDEYKKFYKEWSPFDTYELSSYHNEVIGSWKGVRVC